MRESPEHASHNVQPLNTRGTGGEGRESEIDRERERERERELGECDVGEST